MNINKLFINDFSLSLAGNCAKKREQVARLRYRVFCQEYHFEPENIHQREQDRFDDYAEFALIKYKRNHQAAGCLRVVMPYQEDHLLPFEHYCGAAIHRSHFDLSRIPRHALCEVSRLAVHGDFRGDRVSLCGRVANSKPHGSAHASLLAMTLYAMAALIALRKKRHHMFAMMELRLARGLCLSGIPCEQVGHVIDYHGLRAPFYILAADLLNGIARRHPQLVEMVHHHLATQADSPLSPASPTPINHPGARPGSKALERA